MTGPFELSCLRPPAFRVGVLSIAPRSAKGSAADGPLKLGLDAAARGAGAVPQPAPPESPHPLPAPSAKPALAGAVGAGAGAAATSGSGAGSAPGLNSLSATLATSAIATTPPAKPSAILGFPKSELDMGAAYTPMRVKVWLSANASAGLVEAFLEVVEKVQCLARRKRVEIGLLEPAGKRLFARFGRL